MPDNDTGGAALVVGASGGIGSACVQALLKDSSCGPVYAASRGPCPASWQNSYQAGADFPESDLHWLQCDYSETGITAALARIPETQKFERVILCNGILHTPELKPEKALERIESSAMLQVFAANTVIPMLWLAALLPWLRRSSSPVVAAISARVGSIQDNQSGGWYSYRASKSALNMCLKSAAIELQRRAPGTRLLAFHPGTTDTRLSGPFQRNVPADRLFSSEFVARRLLAVMDSVPDKGELHYLDWAGKTIPW